MNAYLKPLFSWWSENVEEKCPVSKDGYTQLATLAYFKGAQVFDATIIGSNP